MSVAQLKPTSKTNTVVSLPVVQATEIKSIFNDDKYIPRESLISYIEGSPYSVNYYSQIVAAHTELTGHDSGQNKVLQQYTKIIQLELKVTTALVGSPEEETSTTLVTGSANVLPPLIPNVGDMFIASIGDGYDGLFEVKEVSRKSMNHDTVYSIDYVVTGRVSEIPNRISDLDSKVVKTLYFYKDNLLQEKNPFITSDDFNNTKNLSYLYKEMIRYYFRIFFNNEFCTLTIPGQVGSVYDKYVIENIMRVISTSDAPEIIKTRILITDQDRYLHQPTIWNVLFEKNIDMIPFVNPFMGLVSTKLFNGIPTLHGIRFSGIDYVVYPVVTDNVSLDFPFKTPFQLDAYQPTALNNLPYKSLQEVSSQKGDLSQLLKSNTIDPNTNVPYIHNVLLDNYYVFSEFFYRDLNGKSVLESLVYDYLKGNALDIKLLNGVASRYQYWGRLEQYYYIPVVILLIRQLITNI